jgi:hypothetical protein
VRPPVLVNASTDRWRRLGRRGEHPLRADGGGPATGDHSPQVADRDFLGGRCQVRAALIRRRPAIPSSMTRNPFDSCTGRAVSVRRDWPAVIAPATMLIAARQCLASPERAEAALTGRGLAVVISAAIDEILRFNLIKTGIMLVSVAEESVASLQDVVESDPGILLTVDIGRRDVRARGNLVARFDMGSADAMAARLLTAQRLLGSCGLAGDDRVRLQRRLVAIGDALKVPGADAARGAWRLDRLLADIAQAAARPPGRTL